MLISQVYDPADPHIRSDVQFGVTRRLVGNYAHHDNEPPPAPDVTGPWYSLDHTFVMEPGQSGTWDVELGSPNAQLRGGWKIDTFKPGDRIVVNAYQARDGSHIGFARKISKAGK